MKNVKKIIAKLAPSFTLQELETATANYKALEKQDKREAEALLEVTAENYVPEEFKRLVAEWLRDGLELRPAHALAQGLYQFQFGDLDNGIMKLFWRLKEGNSSERLAINLTAAEQWREKRPAECKGKGLIEIIWDVPQLKAHLLSDVSRCLYDLSFRRYQDEAKRNGLEWVKFGGENANA